MIDFHCHLDLYPDPHDVTRECAKRSLYVLSVTTTPSAWKKTSALALGIGRIQTSLGLHPQLAHERKSELSLFADLLPNSKYVGEIGLDGDPTLRPHWNDQIMVFDQILSLCCDAGGRILSIHSRRAATAVLERIQAKHAAGTPVLHWFSGTVRELTRAIELGCWFSVGPSMLNSTKGRALAALMPRDRLLTESDGPFAKIEGRMILPWDAGSAVRELSRIWQEPTESVERQLLANLRQLASTEVPIRSATDQNAPSGHM